MLYGNDSVSDIFNYRKGVYQKIIWGIVCDLSFLFFSDALSKKQNNKTNRQKAWLFEEHTRKEDLLS